MRTVSIRQFHKKMWLELEQLPLVITKNNTPLYVINNYQDKDNVYTSKEDNVYTNVNVYTSDTKNVYTSKEPKISQFKLCKYPMCNEYAVDGSEYCKSHK